MASQTHIVPCWWTVTTRSSSPNDRFDSNTYNSVYRGSAGSPEYIAAARFNLGGIPSSWHIFGGYFWVRRYLNWVAPILTSYWFTNSATDTPTYNHFNLTATWTSAGQGSAATGNWDIQTLPLAELTAAINAGVHRWIIYTSTGNGQNILMYGNDGSASEPIVQLQYGVKVTSLSFSSGLRSQTCSWAASAGANNYDVYRNFVYLGNTASTSWTIYDVKGGTNGSWVVVPIYNEGAVSGNANMAANVSNTASYVPATAISATGDSPIRKRITITKPSYSPTGSAPDSFDYKIVRSSDGATIATLTSQTAASVTYNAEGQAAGQFKVYYRARWDDGDLTDWSSTFATVNITQPTITGFSASTSNVRSITLTWDKISDASSYELIMDGTDLVNVSQPAGSTVSYTYNPVLSGAHSFTVEPLFTNGYAGATTDGAVGGTATLPTPSAPTAVGDSPAKRQIRATSPGAIAASAYHSANQWEFKDTVSGQTVTTTGSTADLSALVKGNHYIQVRAKWTSAPAENTPWSSSSSVVVTTSPPPTDLLTRHKSALAAEASTSISAGLGSLSAGDYFVCVSTNLDGNRATVLVNGNNRAYNESTISPPQLEPLTISANDRIVVSRPSTWVSGDTWNVYVGTDRNKLKRVGVNLTGTTFNVDTFSEPVSNEARIGEVDLQWNHPTGVGDAPLSYRVERAPSIPGNSSSGTPGIYSEVTGLENSTFYSTANRFAEDAVDTKYWFYRVRSLYSNDESNPVEVEVQV